MKSKIKKILSEQELAIVRKLNTPHKIQDFLDNLPFNFEEKEETYWSPRMVLRNKKAHCFEGAVFANLCLTYHDYKNFLMDLKVKKSAKDDQDHTLCIFERNGFWGAISKTNHSVLRWRDPIYKDFKEVAKTYFHEYFLDNGRKTLQSFSKPFNIFAKFGINWITSTEDLDEVAMALDKSPHLDFVPSKNKNLIRKVGKTEIKGALATEWHKIGKRV